MRFFKWLEDLFCSMFETDLDYEPISTRESQNEAKEPLEFTNVEDLSPQVKHELATELISRTKSEFTWRKADPLQNKTGK